MALGVLQSAGAWTKDQAEEFFNDPIAYFIQVARKLGVILLAVGFGLGVVGYYLKAAATTAANNEQTILSNLGQIFSNLKKPSFQPSAMGTAPVSPSLQGIVNFGSDAWKDIQGIGGDLAQAGGAMGTLAEDAGIAITDVAKVMLGFTMHFPDLIWNGAVWALGGSLADVINFCFPYLILAGGFLLIASLVAQGSQWAWKTYVSAGFKAAAAKFQERAKARAERAWDKIFGNFRHPVAETVAPKPIEPVAPIVGQTADAGKGPPSLPEAPEGIQTSPRFELAPSVQAPAAAPPVPEPTTPAAQPNVVGPTPTVQVEEQLGGHQAVEPTAEELATQERERQASLPEPESEEEPEEDLSDVDRQREILMGPLEA